MREPSARARSLVVPMVAGDRVIGSITLATTRRAGGGWAPPTSRWPRSSRGRAGIAVENARVHARAHAHRHHAAAQPAAAAPAGRPGHDHRRALPRRRGGERGRRRLLRPVRRRRRVDGRHGRRHRQGPGRRDDHLAGPLHDAHRGHVRGSTRARARAAERDARRRPRPPPDLHRGLRRASSRRRRTPRRRPQVVCAGHPSPLLVAADGDVRAGRAAGHAARRLRRRTLDETPTSCSAPATRSSSTPTASPTRAAPTAGFGDRAPEALLRTDRPRSTPRDRRGHRRRRCRRSASSATTSRSWCSAPRRMVRRRPRRWVAPGDSRGLTSAHLKDSSGTCGMLARTSLTHGANERGMPPWRRVMERSLPIYASTASRRGHGRGWSRRRRRWARRVGPAVMGFAAALVALLVVGAERLG